MHASFKGARCQCLRQFLQEEGSLHVLQNVPKDFLLSLFGFPFTPFVGVISGEGGSRGPRDLRLYFFGVPLGARAMKEEKNWKRAERRNWCVLVFSSTLANIFLHIALYFHSFSLFRAPPAARRRPAKLNILGFRLTPRSMKSGERV